MTFVYCRARHAFFFSLAISFIANISQSTLLSTHKRLVKALLSLCLTHTHTQNGRYSIYYIWRGCLRRRLQVIILATCLDIFWVDVRFFFCVVSRRMLVWHVCIHRGSKEMQQGKNADEKSESFSPLCSCVTKKCMRSGKRKDETKPLESVTATYLISLALFLSPRFLSFNTPKNKTHIHETRDIYKKHFVFVFARWK